MNRCILLYMLLFCTTIRTDCFAQVKKYLTEKQGSYHFSNKVDHLATKNTAFADFGNNVKVVADYFKQNIPIMLANKGFDLSAVLFGKYDEAYQKRPSVYGIRGTLNFDFQLFLQSAKGDSRWTVEPPNWQVEINNVQTGHGGMIREGEPGTLLNELFVVFPLVEQIASGVRYYDCESHTCGSLIVYNSDRPEYWLPVTVREVAQAKLVASLNDSFMHEYLKKMVSQFSEQELNAPAFN